MTQRATRARPRLGGTLLARSSSWTIVHEEDVMKRLLVAIAAVIVAMGAQVGETRAAAALQHLHGHINSINGSHVAFHTDDGRVLDVNMADVNANVRRELAPNDRITVIGTPDTRRNEFRARFIQDEGRSASGAASPRFDDVAAERIHGRVQSIHGSTLTLRADDGRLMTVDVPKVSSTVRSALKTGEPITIVGRPERPRFAARSIEVDRNGHVVIAP
jgi:hypothetical protein